MNEFIIQTTGREEGYELIDSGAGEKLERYGEFAVARPDPQALWPKRLSQAEWDKAHAYYRREGSKGKWIVKEGVPESWVAKIGEWSFRIAPSPFKHTGVFPEQLSNWRWIGEKIASARERGREVRVLNLFGYTGGATLAAAKAGASVTHVDASKSSIGKARENASLSGLEAAPIKWILDDAKKYADREARRGSAYDAIILDPPTYGRGAKGELWEIENDLMPLLNSCLGLLSKDPLFVLMNGYASGYSALAYKNDLDYMMKNFGGTVEAGELAIKETSSGRLLPAGIFARWSR
ncbi:MAG TPA: class I SAM-dependent methyltransferase [Candidatus Paceibacterota bacterium]|nr:class I SAM-dependent methyltransferase [Candidatus Paceibacterota bacterium]